MKVTATVIVTLFLILSSANAGNGGFWKIVGQKDLLLNGDLSVGYVKNGFCSTNGPANRITGIWVSDSIIVSQMKRRIEDHFQKHKIFLPFHLLISQTVPVMSDKDSLLITNWYIPAAAQKMVPINPIEMCKMQLAFESWYHVGRDSVSQIIFHGRQTPR